jgi:hypothetical protein
VTCVVEGSMAGAATVDMQTAAHFGTPNQARQAGCR